MRKIHTVLRLFHEAGLSQRAIGRSQKIGHGTVAPGLKALYRAKQKLIKYVLLKTLTAKRMKRKLPGFLKLIEQLKESPLRALAKTLQSWLEPIVAMWRFSKSNGITEGFHTKMEMLSRRAYGFRNFENYRLRVLAHCGWDGIVNRV